MTPPTWKRTRRKHEALDRATNDALDKAMPVSHESPQPELKTPPRLQSILEAENRIECKRLWDKMMQPVGVTFNLMSFGTVISRCQSHKANNSKRYSAVQCAQADYKYRRTARTAPLPRHWFAFYPHKITSAPEISQSSVLAPAHDCSF